MRTRGDLCWLTRLAGARLRPADATHQHHPHHARMLVMRIACAARALTHPVCSGGNVVQTGVYEAFLTNFLRDFNYGRRDNVQTQNAPLRDLHISIIRRWRAVR